MLVIEELAAAKTNQKVLISSIKLNGTTIEEETLVAIFGICNTLKPSIFENCTGFIPAIMHSEALYSEIDKGIIYIGIAEDAYRTIAEKYGIDAELAKLEVDYWEFLTDSLSTVKELFESYACDMYMSIKSKGENLVSHFVDENIHDRVVAYASLQKEYREMQNEYKVFVKTMKYLR